jgi:hypothetical protein
MEHKKESRNSDQSVSVESTDNPRERSCREQGTGANESRRRLVKGALGSAPLIMTVASRPAWALNCTHSGQMSGNMSGIAQGDTCGGEGCPPDFWKTHIEEWADGGFGPDASFNYCFGPTFTGADPSLLQVINDDCTLQFAPSINCSCVDDLDSPTTTENYQTAVLQLACHAVAALQNAAGPISFDLTVSQVIEAFQNAYQGGMYCDKDSVSMAISSLITLNTQGSTLCSSGLIMTTCSK